MFLEFILSPIADKNTCTGAVLDNYASSQAFRRSEAVALERRKVAALEKIAKQIESEKEKEAV